MRLKQFLTKPLSELTYVKPSPYSGYIDSVKGTFPNIPTSSIYVPPWVEDKKDIPPQETPEDKFQKIMNNSILSKYNFDLRTGWKDDMFADLLEKNYEYVKINYNIDMYNSKILRTYEIKLTTFGQNGRIILHENNIAEVVHFGSGRPYVDHMIISISDAHN
jgi:hypothetical protein